MQTKSTFIFTIALTLLLTSSATGQWRIGVEAGPDINALRTNISNVSMTKYVPVVSYSVGVPLQYKLSPLLTFETDPSFVRKNYKLEWTGFLSGWYQTTKSNYAEIPLLANFLFSSGRFHLALQGGAFIAYWVTGKLKGTLPDPFGTNYNYDSPYVFRGARDQRLDFGSQAGIRLLYDAGKAGQWFFGATDLISFIDRQKNYETGLIPQYNRTLIFSAGVLFKLSHQ
jgi:hypothetical protein